MIRLGTALVLTVLASTAFSQTPAPSQTDAASPSDTQTSKPPPTVKGLDLSAIDTSADPCEDFYQYACGKWVKGNPVPDDQWRWIRSFSLLRERYLHELRDDLAEAERKPATPTEKKYGDFYAACMDVDELDKKGLEPLQPVFERIAALSDSKGIAALLGDLAAAGEPVGLFTLGLEPDPKDSKKSILSIGQGGLTLDRDVYSGGWRYVFTRYKTYTVHVFMLAGDKMPEAMKEGAAVIEVEKTLARAATDRALRAVPDARYHVVSWTDLEKFAPNVDLGAYFAHLRIPHPATLNVANPEFLKTVDNLIPSVPLDSWKSYFRWQVLSRQASALPKAFRDADFGFWGGNVAHQDAPTPRWKQCAAITDQAFGEALAQNWVKKNFSPAAKAGSEQMVGTLEKALAEEIHTLPWMSEQTKQTAEKKLAAIQNRIGHPQRWRDYSALEVERGDFLGDLHHDAIFEREYLLSRLGKPVPEWGILPTAFKAHYDESTNSLYLPAGAIEPPFFDSGADPAVNFGGLGVLAAHELIHGFDAFGSKYDEHGNVRDWWSADDSKRFADATSCEVAQYRDSLPKSDDAPSESAAANSITVSESTADNGAVRIAYRALMNALVARGKTADDKTDGYTQSQRFFLSFAQGSCDNQSFLSERRSLAVEPQSVGRVRVNDAVQNFEEFGKAFQCTKGKPLFPEKSCRVW